MGTPRPDGRELIVEVTDDLSRDVPVWSSAVRRVLDDLPAAFAHARRVRNLLARRLSWTATADVLQAEVWDGLRRTPRFCPY